MEILFKSDNKVFGINYFNNLGWKYIINNNDDLTNVKHLDDTKILYHYIDDNMKFPVYYEFEGRFVTRDVNDYYLSSIRYYYIKDYTLVNAKLLEDI